MNDRQIIDAVGRAYAEREDELRSRFDRSLSFQDALFDRWERAKRLGFGDGASIYNSSAVFGDVSVGEGTWIGPYTLLDGVGALRIGKYCSISAGVQIYTHDTVKWALSGGKAEREIATVEIGDCCYIGATSIIAKGVRIGHHSVIAANSFVRTEVPPYSIYGGSPASRLGGVSIVSDEIELAFDE